MKVNIAKKVQNKEGFTLVELMIVVAIIGILAAIAIPNFLNYQLKSKTAEAKTNLGAIKTSQASYRAENDFYATCKANPVAVSPTGTKQAWVKPAVGEGWGEIGYAPSADVYYVYEVLSKNDNVAVIGTMATKKTGTDYAASAIANLDKKDKNGEFGYATNEAAAAAIPVDKTTGAKGKITKVNTIQDTAPGQF